MWQRFGGGLTVDIPKTQIFGRARNPNLGITTLCHYRRVTTKNSTHSALCCSAEYSF
jgi:hypothetical protein